MGLTQDQIKDLLDKMEMEVDGLSEWASLALQRSSVTHPAPTEDPGRLAKGYIKQLREGLLGPLPHPRWRS